MSIMNNLNAAIGSCLFILLITVDFLRKSNTDRFQRKLLIIMLFSVFLSALFDFISSSLEGNPGEKLSKALLFTCSVYLISRFCLFYFSAVFIDYFSHGSVSRTKRLSNVITVFFILYCISMIINIKAGFYFYISRENVYRPGIYYTFHTLLSYFPILIILIDLGFITKHVKRSQVICIIIFVLLIAAGAAADMILGTTKLIWPCITAAILYIYLFIIRYDSKKDSLTGMENRNSFNEYIKNLYSHSNKKTHTFIMFDIVRFKEINKFLGHIKGDSALRDLSLILRSCIRNTDFSARLGGDEFIIVTIGISNVSKIIKRINDAIDKLNKKLIRPYQLYINFSSGVFSRDSGVYIQDFIDSMDTEINKNKELKNEEIISIITADYINMNNNKGGSNV